MHCVFARRLLMVLGTVVGITGITANGHAQVHRRTNTVHRRQFHVDSTYDRFSDTQNVTLASLMPDHVQRVSIHAQRGLHSERAVLRPGGVTDLHRAQTVKCGCADAHARPQR